MLGALSSEAIGGFTSLSNLGGLGIGNGFLSIIAAVDGYVFSGDFVTIALLFAVPGLGVVSVPVEQVVFLLELVISSGGRLGLAL